MFRMVGGTSVSSVKMLYFQQLAFLSRALAFVKNFLVVKLIIEVYVSQR